MKNKTWKIIFVLIVIAIILLLVFAFRKPKDEGKKAETCPDGKTPIPSNGICPQSSITNAIPDATGCIQPSSYSNYQYPIKKGMKDGFGGKAVSDLQKKINYKYKAGLKEDGYWGCITESAIKKYLGVTEINTNNPIWSVQIPTSFLG